MFGPFKDASREIQERDFAVRVQTAIEQKDYPALVGLSEKISEKLENQLFGFFTKPSLPLIDTFLDVLDTLKNAPEPFAKSVGFYSVYVLDLAKAAASVPNAQGHRAAGILLSILNEDKGSSGRLLRSQFIACYSYQDSEQQRTAIQEWTKAVEEWSQDSFKPSRRHFRKAVNESLRYAKQYKCVALIDAVKAFKQSEAAQRPGITACLFQKRHAV